MTGIEVAGEATTGREAISLIASLAPDVVLMDITMPELGGLQAAARVSAEYPSVRVIMLSMHDNEEYVWQALRAGAAGYLLKSADSHELELAIRSVARGLSYLSPAVSGHIVSDYMRRQGIDHGPRERLTPRQIEIVQLIAEGNTNQEIAEALQISVKTVESHRSQLMSIIRATPSGRYLDQAVLSRAAGVIDTSPRSSIHHAARPRARARVAMLSGPARNNALLQTSDQAGSAIATDTATRPPPPGSPVAGSIRW
jgi:DNA-binding NarL/FixJ family response regulator